MMEPRQNLPVSTGKKAGGLPLFNLPPIFRKKVISQLEQKSFYRIQRTCKQVKEIAENIIRFLDNTDPFYTDIKKDEDGNHGLIFTFVNHYQPSYEMPRSVRFNTFRIPDDFEEDFDLYCDLLKKYRISAKSITTSWYPEPTKEQMIELITILKPIHAFIPRCFNGIEYRYEALLEFSGFEKIDTEIYFPLPNDMLQIQTTIMKFMSITQDLDLKVATNKLTTDQLYELLIYIVQNLNSETFPNLCKVILRGRSPSGFEIERSPEIFRDYNPTVTDTQHYQIYMDLRLQNIQSSCKVGIDKSCVAIDYQKIAPVFVD